MNWMAKALHRFIGSWMAEALHRFQNETKGCMKSKRGPDCKTLQGSHMSWVADVHRLRLQV